MITLIDLFHCIRRLVLVKKINDMVMGYLQLQTNFVLSLGYNRGTLSSYRVDAYRSKGKIKLEGVSSCYQLWYKDFAGKVFFIE